MPDDLSRFDSRKPCVRNDACSPNQPTCCFSKARQPKDLQGFCCLCAHRRKASPLACLGICILIVTYTFLGAVIFLAIEGTLTFQKEETAVAASMPNLSQSDNEGYHLRSKTVERLWSITEDLNILYKENWTRLAAKELMEFQKVLMSSSRGGHSEYRSHGYSNSANKHRWTFATSFLYSLTLITTIGYGNVAPKSPLGKFAAIAYSCIGIPIVMLYLSTVGESLARNFRILYSKIFNIRPKPMHTANCFYSQQSYNTKCISDYKKPPADDFTKRTPFQAALNLEYFNGKYHWTCRDHTRVPIILSVFLMTLYIGLGAFIFYKTEKWTILDGCYFSFSSLATIGFGGLYPGAYGSTVSNKFEDLAVGACSAYILVGIVFVAMCFNLIQEEVAIIMRNIALFCSGNPKPRAVHSSSRDPGDEISMSIVS